MVGAKRWRQEVPRSSSVSVLILEVKAIAWCVINLPSDLLVCVRKRLSLAQLLVIYVVVSRVHQVVVQFC